MSQAHKLTIQDVQRLTGGRLGTFDVLCHACGPHRRSTTNRCRPVLRIWAKNPGFANYYCARCGLSGWARAETDGSLEPVRLGALRAEKAQADCEHRHKQSDKAIRLYRCAGPPQLAGRYLAGRGISVPSPATLRVATYGQHLAMVMPFGLPGETEPDALGAIPVPWNSSGRCSDCGADRPTFGVHLTLLTPDASAKAGTARDKFMLGPSAGVPLVVAPPNDGLGLVITEGIEDALSAHQVTGLGAWAAGAACRLPALADCVPRYVEVVTILVDSDEAGRKHAGQLAKRLADRGFETRAVELRQLL